MECASENSLPLPPRVVVSAPSSGSGKTTVTCALLRLLSRRFGAGAVAAFKAGPDFIDPLFHAHVLGSPLPMRPRTGTLDLFFSGGGGVRSSMARISGGAEIAVVEGAMGYYDGADPAGSASAWALASELSAPALLVVDARRASLSSCAVVEGFARFRESDGDRSKIAGVVFNRVSAGRYASLSRMVEEECGIPALGFLPDDPSLEIGSRRLGLLTPDAVDGLDAKVERLSEVASGTLDLDGIAGIAASAPPVRAPAPAAARPPLGARIAVASDRAFCFCYPENLRLLSDFGAETAFFSPLADEPVPDGSSALYVPGGYPELFPEALSGASRSAASVRAFVRSGAPVLAECGGFLYLQMLGLLPGGFRDEGRPVRFGYAELTAEEDSFLCARGAKVRAHEFHHFDTTANGSAFSAVKPDGTSWRCVNVCPPVADRPSSRAAPRSVVAGFPHFFLPSNPVLAENFVSAAIAFASERDSASFSGECGNCQGCQSCQGCQGCQGCASCQGCQGCASCQSCQGCASGSNCPGGGR